MFVWQKGKIQKRQQRTENNSYVFDIITEFSSEQDRILSLGLSFVSANLEFQSAGYDKAIKYYNECLSLDKTFSLIYLLKGLAWFKSSLEGRKPQIGIQLFRQAVQMSADPNLVKQMIKKYMLKFAQEIIADLDADIFTSSHLAIIRFRKLKAILQYLMEISVLTISERFTLHCQLKDLAGVEVLFTTMERSDLMRFYVMSMVPEINNLRWELLAKLN
jgi:tetratricopeptide (TPR) repeat protein